MYFGTWLHGLVSMVALQRFTFACFHVSRTSRVAPRGKRVVCVFFSNWNRKKHRGIVQTARETWKAHTHFLRLESKSADDAWIALSSDSRSAYKIHGVRLE